MMEFSLKAGARLDPGSQVLDLGDQVPNSDQLSSHEGSTEAVQKEDLDNLVMSQDEAPQRVQEDLYPGLGTTLKVRLRADGLAR